MEETQQPPETGLRFSEMSQSALNAFMSGYNIPSWLLSAMIKNGDARKPAGWIQDRTGLSDQEMGLVMAEKSQVAKSRKLAELLLARHGRKEPKTGNEMIRIKLAGLSTQSGTHRVTRQVRCFATSEPATIKNLADWLRRNGVTRNTARDELAATLKQLAPVWRADPETAPGETEYLTMDWGVIAAPRGEYLELVIEEEQLEQILNLI